MGDKLKADLEKRIEEIKERYENPPPPPPRSVARKPKEGKKPRRKKRGRNR